MATNITPAERIGRVALGLALLVVGAALFSGADAFGYRAIAGAVALFGLDMLVTGALGFCPLYYKLGRKALTTAPHSRP